MQSQCWVATLQLNNHLNERMPRAERVKCRVPWHASSAIRYFALRASAVGCNPYLTSRYQATPVSRCCIGSDRYACVARLPCAIHLFCRDLNSSRDRASIDWYSVKKPYHFPSTDCSRFGKPVQHCQGQMRASASLFYNAWKSCIRDQGKLWIMLIGCWHTHNPIFVCIPFDQDGCRKRVEIGCRLSHR